MSHFPWQGVGGGALVGLDPAGMHLHARGRQVITPGLSDEAAAFLRGGPRLRPGFASDHWELDVTIATAASISTYAIPIEGHDTTYAGRPVLVPSKLVYVGASMTTNTTGINWTLRIRKNQVGSDADTFVYALSGSAWAEAITFGAPVTGAVFARGDRLNLLTDGSGTTGGMYGRFVLRFLVL